jgi:hypothetical protein
VRWLNHLLVVDLVAVADRADRAVVVSLADDLR